MRTDCKPTLNAKLLNEKLKSNWGTAQFAKYLQMSELEFEKILSDIFEGPAGESFRRRIKKNDSKIEKRNEQQRKRKAASVKTLEEKTVEVTVQENATETADSSETSNNEENDMDALEKLQIEEEFYRKYLISLENDHKDAVAERKQLFEVLAKFREKMLELKKEIEECRLKSQDYTAQKDQVSAKIEKINQDKAETKKQIAEIQEQIKKLQKIEVYVDNEDIEIVPEDYEIPDGWKELRREWLDDERFESLTLMELSILAKAILLAKAISADSRKSIFVFESDQMQNLFSELSK